MPPLSNDRLCSCGDRLARLAHFRGNPRQPDVQQEAGRVLDQLVVLVGPHEGLLLGRLAVLKARVGGNVDAGDAVVLQADRLRQAGPHVDHVRHHGVPIEIGGALARGGERLVVVVGQLLAGVAGVDPGELGHERPDGNHVGLAVAHRRDVAVQPALVAGLPCPTTLQKKPRPQVSPFFFLGTGQGGVLVQRDVERRRATLLKSDSIGLCAGPVL